MAEQRDHHPLSRVELIVLARLSALKPLTKADIARSLRQIGVPFVGPDLEDCVTAALASLASRGLVTETPQPSSAEHHPAAFNGKRSKTSKRHKKPKRGPPRFALADAGRVTLRSALGLKKTPSWKEMCDRVVPALALGETPGEAAADAALDNVDAMMTVWLRRDRTLGAAVTIAQLCDHVIARALGMPPGLATPAGIRAYALAKHCGVDSKAEFEHIASMFEPAKPASSAKSKTPESRLKSLAVYLVRKQLGVEIKRKPTMIRELVRHWVSQQDESDGAQRPSAPWSTSPRVVAVTNAMASAGSTPPPSMVVADSLFIAVQDAIPKVGSDGRYGKENVFVSALWRELAHDWRLLNLSLDDFKQWLVAANRDQLLALARADLVDDMDSRLVEDSEIEDLGETFHFVIDSRKPLSASGQMHHVR